MRFSRRILATCVGLYVFSQILFLINIQFPRGQNFDEFHYVPSAKQFLELRQNQNSEHPPLGKEIMAVGIALWGDRPIGWRFMSTVFGSLTLVGMYLWALVLFRDEKLAFWTALLTLVNQLLYVQARIGMLDTFMFAFMVWGMAAFTATWRTDNEMTPKLARRYLLASGIFFGLATCCKWFGVIPWFTCLGLVLLVRMFQQWETTFKKPHEHDWYDPRLWAGLTIKDFALYLGLVPLGTYYVPFLAYLLIDSPDYSFFKIFWKMQYDAWDAQGRVVNSHPYMSTWTQWATLKRPIWYAFDHEGSKNELVRGVILLGNPWVMWSGLVALVFCAFEWFYDRSREAFLILVFFGALYLSWAFIPRKIAFFYYYYPAGMVLSLALAYVLRRNSTHRWIFLGVATGFFIYFFPISAALQIPAEEFRKWMWWQSWI